jgi:hypothetical protein
VQGTIEEGELRRYGVFMTWPNAANPYKLQSDRYIDASAAKLGMFMISLQEMVTPV